MPRTKDAYSIDGICFIEITNRNEARVIKEIQQLIKQKETPPLSHKDWQDVYALALNSIPPRYVQSGTIVLRDPVLKQSIAKAVSDAMVFVHSQPKI